MNISLARYKCSWFAAGFAFIAAACATGTRADDRDDAARRHNENTLAADKAFTEDSRAFADANRYLVRRGLVADRTTRRITIRAEATGISSTEPVEFFLIGPESGKGYESLATSFAKPSDIDAAIQFLGLPRGRSVDFNKLLFWPKGERVRMTFDWLEPPAAENARTPAAARSIRVENLLSDRNAANGALRETGLVFVGSGPLADDAGQSRYAADVGDPGSIASNYNEPTTVLDLPMVARQSAVYASRTANGTYRFPRQTADHGHDRAARRSRQAARLRHDPERLSSPRRDGRCGDGCRVRSAGFNPRRDST